MKTVLKIELIGDDQRQRLQLYRGIVTEAFRQRASDSLIGRAPSPGWCAECRLEAGKIKREFLRGQKDYSEANGKGSRGVYLYFYLDDDGRVYDVFERTSWSSSDRYFCTVKNGQIARLTKDEAMQCLKNRWEPMY